VWRILKVFHHYVDARKTIPLRDDEKHVCCHGCAASARVRRPFRYRNGGNYPLQLSRIPTTSL